jgi:hypothetical protein
VKLELRRLEIAGDATLGELRAEGQWLCWTLEDRVRAQKIKHQTAIPAGQYAISLSQSQRFGTVLPMIHDVPEFTGIRIHAGNSPADTSGCVLVGLTREGDRIGRSREALELVMARLRAVGVTAELCTIEITQPAEWPKWNERVTVSLPREPEQSISPVPSGAIGRVEHLPVVLPGAQPDDYSRPVTVDGGQSKTMAILTWISGIGAGGWAVLKENSHLLIVVIVFVAVVAVVHLVRGLVLDYQRLKIASDPSRYNVH